MRDLELSSYIVNSVVEQSVRALDVVEIRYVHCVDFGRGQRLTEILYRSAKA